MAGNIKGITIEIGGETTGLQKALKGVNSQSIELQKELKQVDNLLKFNPGNAELVSQKQKLLADQVATTTDKLKQLKEAQSHVDAQFASGKINEEQYRAFNREVAATEGSLNGLKNKLSAMQAEQDRAASSTKQLNTLFEATGTSVDQYANSLGSKLVNAIKNGTASSHQLDTAISKIGKEALGSSTDIDKLKKALSSVDDGASLSSVKKDLSKVAKEAEQAGDKINGFGDNLKNVVAGLAAGGGIAGAISAALDTSSLNTKIDISFEVPESSRASVKEAINTVTSYGVDAEEALEGVRRQWALNKDASDESNAAVIEGAGTIAAAYAGIDFTELIQEANEIGSALEISNEEALGLVNSLLKTGFPPDQLDIIAEYGEQLHIAGYNAQEVQNILSAAVDTKSWNIDNLLDGLKEGKIGLSEFGLEVPKATKELLANTTISTKQLQTWGKAVASGGKEGSQAMVEVAKALAGVEDATLRNELGVQLFGTKFEDQGMKIVDTLINAEKGTADLGEGINQLADSTAKLNADPVVAMKQALADMKVALEPLLMAIASFISKIALWGAENPKLLATIVAVGTAVGVLIGAIAALSPAFISISGAIAGAGGAATVFGAALAVLTGPIGLTVAGIAAVTAAGVLLYQNWDTLMGSGSNLKGVIAGIAPGLTLVVGAIKGVQFALSSAIPEAQIFGEEISNSTQKVVGAYLDLDTNVSTALNQVAWSQQTITGKMASDLIGQYSEMNNQILTTMQTKHEEQLTQIQSFFSQSKTLTATEEAAIVANVQKSQEEQQQKVTDGQNRIKEILTAAKDGKRAITEAEKQEINSIQENMKTTAVKVMSQNQTEQKAILENLKSESGKITAQQAADVVKNATGQKEKVVKEANEQYVKTKAEIESLRDDSKVITKDQADKLIEEAERQRDDTVSAAEDTHEKVVTEAKSQANEHVEQVNWETGEVKSNWEVLKTDVSTKMKTLGKNISSSWKAALENTKEKTGSIKETASTKFGEMKTSVGKKMDEVKGKVETGWNKAQNFLEGIDLIKIGKDIVNGLIKGIGDKFGDVKAKIEELAGLIPDWAKDILDINSPSRVMATEVGKWIPEGIAVGIENNISSVKKASTKMAVAAVPDFSSKIAITKAELTKLNKVISSVVNTHSKEINKIQLDADKQRETITSDANKKIIEIEQKAKESKKALTSAQERQIANIYEKAYKDRAKVTVDEKKKISAIDKSLNADKLKALEEHVSKRKGLEKMTTEQEVEFWQAAIKKFKKGTDEKTQAQINYNKALDTLNKEQFDKEKDYIEDKKYYNKLSLSEELAAYQQYLKEHKKGSEERIYYEKEIYRVKQEIQKQIDQINEDYLSKVQALNQSLIDEENKLNEEYKKALDDRAKSLYSFAGIFDEIAAKDVSGDTLLNNLQSQVTAFEDWQRNISELASKGINYGLLAELEEMGPKAGSELAALNTLTDEQLNQYVTLWQEKNRLATEQATKELEGMKLETEKKVNELRLKTADQLRVYQNEWRNAMIGVKGKVKNEMTEMPGIGEYAVSGLIQGLNAKRSELISTAQAMANAVKETFQSALDIHSPSRVFKGFGININEGLIQGIQQSSRQLEQAMNSVYGSLASSSEKMIQNNSPSTGTNPATQSSTTIENNYNFTYHSPKAIDPYESSRLARNSLRELALQV